MYQSHIFASLDMDSWNCTESPLLEPFPPRGELGAEGRFSRTLRRSTGQVRPSGRSLSSK